MSIDLIDIPEITSLELRGTFNKKSGTPLIFQRSHGKLQKKIGPIIPTNPRTRFQQLNRLLFRAAMNRVNALTSGQKQLFRERLGDHQKGLTWRLLAFKYCLKPNRFNQINFNEGMFFGGVPPQPIYRFDEVTFDDAFFTGFETLPLDEAALRAAFPSLHVDALFSGE